MFTSKTSSKTAKEKTALGTAAALDKGVKLNPEALERYARYFGQPDFTGQGKSGQENNNPGNGKESSQNKTELPAAEELKAIADKEAKKDDLLHFLNTIPGKNGQYWMIYPFKINQRGTEIEVFLRILKGEPFFTGENERIIVDIAGPKRQYRCFLKKIAGKLRADIRVHPPLSPRTLKVLQKKAERFLGASTGLAGNSLDFGEILVSSGEETGSWVEDWCTESLLSVNKEV